MSDNDSAVETPTGQETGSEVLGEPASVARIDRHAKFKRQPVAPRSIVPPKEGRVGLSVVHAEDLQQAIVAAFAGLDEARRQQQAKEARKQARAASKMAALPPQAQAAAQAAGRKPGSPSLPAMFIGDAIAGHFGECAAEVKEDTMLVRRWNNSFWELMFDTAGVSEAMDWLLRKFPDAVGKSKATDCWASLQYHLYKHKPFVVPENDEAEEVVFPLQDGYLRITPDGARLTDPDKSLGLTFQVKAKSCVTVGETFTPQAVPEDSRFGRYLASSLPDPELRDLVQEQCAMSFLPNSHQTVAWWVGEGGAGKGTLSKLIEAFHHKVATLDLHKLAEPHHLEALVGASVIRVDEVAQKGIWGEKEFKSIVSGDVFMINPKHKKNYTHRTTAYWIITTNQPPLIRDESDGVRRRIVPVPWLSSARLRGSSEQDLDRKILKHEAHLVLGWIVEGLQRYLRRGGPLATKDLPAPVKELMGKIHRQNDNVEQWFEECEVVPADPNYGFVHTKKEIYEDYVKFTELDGGNVLREESFWIRFWRRPGLKANGVLECKGTARDEAGAKIRIKQIQNLALTPQEIARVKKDALIADVISQGRFVVERQEQTVYDDPFGDDPVSRSEVCENQIPQFNDGEVRELRRLEALACLTR